MPMTKRSSVEEKAKKSTEPIPLVMETLNSKEEVVTKRKRVNTGSARELLKKPIVG